ncbi:hypothetical protein HHK36_013780 [Tetracentron sinense]|uniref:Ubiquitin-like protease family profile domain-containing protein n=1 Tax=Tetracentron sinense TaxID=13715 RepID=A0A834Z6V2_TETSI|nr:hypothetical protein HHK36_013780 [Tetracentron sinense]
MASLSRELVFLILQFLEEKNFAESVHKVEQESGFYFNMKYFNEKTQAGEWEEVESYLSGFTKFYDNKYSRKIFFEIRKQKYLEALDRQDKGKAVEILEKDLKVFSVFDEELYQEISQLLSLDNFRENKQLSMYGDTKSARSILMVALEKLIEANPLLRDKLVFPTVKMSQLQTLFNQSLNQLGASSVPFPRNQDSIVKNPITPPNALGIVEYQSSDHKELKKHLISAQPVDEVILKSLMFILPYFIMSCVVMLLNYLSVVANDLGYCGELGQTAYLNGYDMGPNRPWSAEEESIVNLYWNNPDKRFELVNCLSPDFPLAYIVCNTPSLLFYGSNSSTYCRKWIYTSDFHGITHESLYTLRGANWVNSEVVDGYCCLLKKRERASPNVFITSHFFKSEFINEIGSAYRRWVGGNPLTSDLGSSLRTILGPRANTILGWVDPAQLGYKMTDCDKLFFPVCSIFNWFVVILYMKDRKIELWNPVRCDSLDNYIAEMQSLVNFFPILLAHTGHEMLDLMSWPCSAPYFIPTQKDSNDCGVFAMKYIDCAARGIPCSFTQEDMPWFRRKLLLDLVNDEAALY